LKIKKRITPVMKRSMKKVENKVLKNAVVENVKVHEDVL
jgi:hypothetical protein